MKLSCPTADRLREFLEGSVDDAEANQISGHVVECPSCDRVLGTLESEQNDVLKTLREGFRTESLLQEPEFEQLRNTARFSQADTTASSEIDEQPATGKRLRDYRLVKKIGEGGMGTVYQAVHVHLAKHVALKILPADKLQSKQSVSRFRQEMRAVGSVNHPNVVSASDAGTVDGQHFLVMELIQGADLARIIRDRGPLSVADACDIVRQAAIGLQHAHDNGLVHRDVKPSNIMLALDGSVKLLDLGLAGLNNTEFESTANVVVTDRLTSVGQIMGTLDYMAPEQITASPQVDGKADIYALGATLFQLLTGRTPCGDRSEGTPERIEAVLHNPPLDIRALRNDVPEELCSLLQKMLAKDPADRPQSAIDVAGELVRFTSDADLDTLAEACRTSLDMPSADVDVTDDVSFVVSRAEPRAKVPARRPVTAVALVGLVLTLFAAVVYYIVTNNGIVRVEVLDESFRVAIDGQTVTVTEGNNQPIKLRPGEHKLVVTAGDAELLTDNFAIRRGDKLAFKVELLAGHIVVSKDGKELDREPLPATASSRLLTKEQQILADLASEERFANLTKNVKQLTADQARTYVSFTELRARAFYGLTRLDLSNVSEISDDVAIELANHRGWLILNGLTTLSDESARALSRHQGRLYLNGLTTLSDEVAQLLAQHRLWPPHGESKGGLHLDGLTTLSDEAARALAQAKGDLYLRGLKTLSGEAASILRKRDDIRIPAELIQGQLGLSSQSYEFRRVMFATIERNARECSISDDRRTLLVTLQNERIQLWDVDKIQPIAPPVRVDFCGAHHGFVPQHPIAWNTDFGGKLRFWDARTGKMIGAPLKCVTGESKGLAPAFAPDGRYMVTEPDNKRIQFWDLSSGVPTAITPPIDHGSEVGNLAFSSDGQWAFSRGHTDDESVRIWNPRTGELVAGPFRSDLYEFTYSAKRQELVTFENVKGRIANEAADRIKGEAVIRSSADADWKVVRRISLPGRAEKVRWIDPSRLLVKGRVPGMFWGRPGAVASALVVSLDADKSGSAQVIVPNDFWENDWVHDAIPARDGEHWIAVTGFTLSYWKIGATKPIWQYDFAKDSHRRRIELGHGDWFLLHEGRRTPLVFSESDGKVLWRWPSAGFVDVNGQEVLACDSTGVKVWRVQSEREGETAFKFRKLPTTKKDDFKYARVAVSIDHQAAISRNYLVTGGEDVRDRIRAHMWSLDPDSPKRTRLPDSTIFGFIPNTELAYQVSWGDGVLLWDTRTHKRVGEAIPHELREGSMIHPAVSPDGARLVARSEMNQLRFWDLRSRKATGSPLELKGTVNGMAFSPDGKWFFTRSRPQKLTVWDPRGKLVAGPFRHDLIDGRFPYAPATGQFITAENNDKEEQVWKSELVVRRGEAFHEVRRIPFEGHIREVRWVGNTHLLVVSDNKDPGEEGPYDYGRKVAQLVSLAEDSPRISTLLRYNWIRSINISPDGEHFTIETREETSCWKLGNQEPVWTKPGDHLVAFGDRNWVLLQAGGVATACSVGDGKELWRKENIDKSGTDGAHIWTCSEDEIEFWLVERTEEASTNKEKSRIHKLASSDAAAGLEVDKATSASRGYAKLIDEAHQALQRGNRMDGERKLASTDPDLRGWEYDYLLTQSQQIGQERHRWQQVCNYVELGTPWLAFTPDNRLLFPGKGGTVAWDYRLNNSSRMLPEAGPRSVAVSADGKKIVMAGNDAKVQVWDAEAGEKLVEYTRHNPENKRPGEHETRRRISMALSPDSTKVVSAAYTDSPYHASVRPHLHIWSAENGKTIHELDLADYPKQWGIRCVAWSPDGKRIATGGSKLHANPETVRLWDPETGQTVRAIKAHGANVLAVAFSPQGDRLVSASEDRTIAVWEVSSGRQLLHLRGLDHEPVVAWSLDGKRIVSGDWSGRIRFWDSQTGVEVFSIDNLPARVSTVVFGPDGQQIAATGGGPKGVFKPTVWSSESNHFPAAHPSEPDKGAANDEPDEDRVGLKPLKPSTGP